VREELKRKKKCLKQKDTTRQGSVYSNINAVGREAQNEKKEMSGRMERSNVGTSRAKRRVLMDLF